MTEDPQRVTASKPLQSETWFMLAMKEYDYHQKAIDKFDGERQRVRSWAITVAGALFAASASQDDSRIVLGAVVTTAFFFWLESTFVHYETGVLQRLRRIDKMVSTYLETGEGPCDFRFGTSQAYFSARRTYGEVSPESESDLRPSWYKANFQRSNRDIWLFHLVLIGVVVSAYVVL